MKYTCEICGQVHESLPAIAFDAPYHYQCLSDEEKNSIAELNSDFCIITYEDQIDRFVRAVLYQKVKGHCEDLHYGVWVSLSEKSFQDYKAHFDNDSHEAVYFGYLSNWIPGYENTTSIKTNVEVAGDGNRPVVIPHDNQMDHCFVADYFHGISKEEAEARVKAALGG